MPYNFIQTLEDLMQAIKLRKVDDGLDGEQRRNWAIAYTDAQKLYAFIKTYLVESEEQ
jgi:hypothetical protein